MARYRNIVLFLALIVVVSSSLLSYFVVMKNDLKIASLTAELQVRQPLIRDIWFNHQEKENKVNMAVLLSILPLKQNQEIESLINYYIANLASSVKKSGKPLELLNAVTKEKKMIIDRINDLYSEQIDIQQQIEKIERNNKFYSNMAFFLQLLSIIFLILEKLIRS